MRLHARSFIDVTGKIRSGLGPPAWRALAGASILCTSLCTPALFAQQSPPPTYAVDGTVLDSLTRQPIARALVDGQNDAVLTDSEGRFELHLPAGVNPISVRRPGYQGSTHGGMTTAIMVRENMSPLTFHLTPSAGITGHVSLATGDAADGFPLTLYRRRSFNGHTQWLSSGVTSTGSDGVFHFVALDAPGSYVLCSAPSPDRNASGQNAPINAPISGYPGLCFPGGADLTSAIAVPLTLAPGQQAQVEISLPRAMFYPVSISVAAGSGNVNTSFPQIFDRSGLPMTSGISRNQKTGTFEVALPNGSYYAEVNVWGATRLYGRLDFTVAGAPLAGLTVVPMPQRPITVQVSREFTANPQQGPGGQTVGLWGNDSGIGMTMRPADNPLVGDMGVNLRRSPDSGLLEMYVPSQGTYWLEPQAFGTDVYVSSMTSGNTDLLQQPLVIGPDNGAPEIGITLRNDVGWLECSAKAPVAATPAADTTDAELRPVFVYAIPQSPNPRRIYQSVTQVPNGANFPLPLPPGNYLVVAFDQDHEIDLDDREEMSKLASQGQTVTIEPGATMQLQVAPISADEQEAQQ